MKTNLRIGCCATSIRRRSETGVAGVAVALYATIVIAELTERDARARVR